MDIRIVVLHRGNIVIGDRKATMDRVVIRRCAVIRRWGTEKGLGQLAREGPLDATVLDWCPTVETHILGEVFNMRANQEVWTKVLEKYGSDD